MSLPKAYVHLAYGIAAGQYRARYAAGLVPDETPYGFHHAASMGWQVEFSQDHAESAIVRLLRKGLIRLLGFDLVHAFRNRAGIRQADIVWTMEEIEYLAICALPLLVSGPRPRLIAQTIWLFNHWQRHSAARRWMLEKLLRRADLLTFHSRQYLPLVSALVPGLDPHLLPFGISLDTFPWNDRSFEAVEPGLSEPAARLRVLSMGNDPTRDWPTLLAAFGNDPRFELTVISGRLSDAAVAACDNVKCPRNPTMQSFRDLYRWADLVVVPMVPNRYSGITVALEATSMGVPVLCSDTGGVPTYFSAEEVLYVPPGDAGALRDAVLAWLPAQRHQQVLRAQSRFRREDYSSRGMARRYATLSAELLAR